MSAKFRLERLRVEGFKAFTAPQSIELGRNLFIFGKNGHGKSSIVEAIRWCLFGLGERQGQEAEVQNAFYSSGDCQVQLELRGPGGLWTLHRRLRPGSLRSDLEIRDPNGEEVLLGDMLPNMARLGPREGTHIIFSSQQASSRRPQADITAFDRVLYAYLHVDEIPDLIKSLKDAIEEQIQNEQQLAEMVEAVDTSFREKLSELRSRMDEIQVASPWPGKGVPTNAETSSRLKRFVKECGGETKQEDGDTPTNEWLLSEAQRAISAFSETISPADLADARAALSQLVNARQGYLTASKAVQDSHIRAESAQASLNKLLEQCPKAKLLEDRDRLIRRNAELTLRLAIVNQASELFDRFRPEHCPICDDPVDSVNIAAVLKGSAKSDDDLADLATELDAINTDLARIGDAELENISAKSALDDEQQSLSTALDLLKPHIEDFDDPVGSSELSEQALTERITALEREQAEAGGALNVKRSQLQKLQAEVRFQGYRMRESVLVRALSIGMKPARDTHATYNDMLDTLRRIHEVLQRSFNDVLNETLPKVGALMTDVFGRLTQQASFPKIVIQPGPAEAKRTLELRVTSDATPGQSFDPNQVLNGQAFNASILVPYFVFSQFQADALELDCLLIDDPSQSFDTSRVELLLKELSSAASHAQLIVCSHEEEKFAESISKYFEPDSYAITRVVAFSPDQGPTLAS